MIIDHVDNILKYEALLPNLRKGLEAVAAVKNGAGLAPGRYEFEGGVFHGAAGRDKAYLGGNL